MDSKFPEALKKTVVCRCSAESRVFRDKVGSLKCPKCGIERDIGSFKSQEEAAKAAIAGGTFVKGMDTSASKMLVPAALMLSDGFCEPKKLLLLKGENTIGRKAASSRASIQLETEDEYMGRNHARIELNVRPDRSFYEYCLSDMGSANGTWKNKKKIEQGDIVMLQQYDTIRLGRTVFRFMLQERAN
jgi:ribosomal protein L37AE/L43A